MSVTFLHITLQIAYIYQCCSAWSTRVSTGVPQICNGFKVWTFDFQISVEAICGLGCMLQLKSLDLLLWHVFSMSELSSTFTSAPFPLVEIVDAKYHVTIKVFECCCFS